MSWKERMIILILAGLNFTHILDFMIMMPLGNYLMPYFDITARQFSFLVGAYTLSAFVSGFAVAFFVDRFDRKKILLLGYIGFLAGTLACGFSPGYYWLLIFRIVAGVFGGLIGAQVLSIISDMFGYERRGMAMGAVISSFAVASTLGVPFALYLSNIFSWHAPFLLVGFLGFLIVPLIMKFIPPVTGHLAEGQVKIAPLKMIAMVLRVPQQRNALLFTALIMMGHFLVIPFVNPFLEFNVGYSKAQTPLIYLAGGAASFVSAHVLGRLSDRYGKMIIFTTCVLLSLFVVWGITNLPPIPFSLTLCLFAVWFTLSTGRMVTANAMISNIVQSGQRGSFMSFNSSFQQLGTALASFVAGFVIIKQPDNRLQHYDWLGYLSIAILIISLIMAGKLFTGMDKREMKARAGKILSEKSKPEPEATEV